MMKTKNAMLKEENEVLKSVLAYLQRNSRHYCLRKNEFIDDYKNKYSLTILHEIVRISKSYILNLCIEKFLIKKREG